MDCHLPVLFWFSIVLLLLFMLMLPPFEARPDSINLLRSEFNGRQGKAGNGDSVETRWAVLIAGSSGYANYRHQADVCHAYQIMKNGGLKDENIIVFMYDDIANNVENPRLGTIINHPHGGDVYAGVPKDYVGDDVNVNNFLAVILGDKSNITGGSGKIVDSGPNDNIFIFYTDHGGPGVLGMPKYPPLYAIDLIDVLKKKHATNSYKSMVIYVEACESGSIFEGLLPKNIGIYVTTASNAVENSYGTYCPHDNSKINPEYTTCLGDLYSVSWMEDSDIHNLNAETLNQQYKLVKTKTSDNNTYKRGSHVMQYGEFSLNIDDLSKYIGSNPINGNYSYIENDYLLLASSSVNQRDADLIYYWHKFRNSPEGSSKKLKAHKELLDIMTHRLHVDNSISLIGKLLFGLEKGMETLTVVRPNSMPLVDDWACLKSMVQIFEAQCGSLSQYGLKHMRSFANICNSGIKRESMANVCVEVCN